MIRVKLTVEYDGTDYCGWQKQPGRATVEGTLREALAPILGELPEITAAGRTDAGVHAYGQVVHLDVKKERAPQQVLLSANSQLRGKGIAILEAEEVAPTFHARFSALERFYCYKVVNRRAPLALDNKRAYQVYQPLDIQAMQKAAVHLTGHHDFSSFRDSQCQAAHAMRTVNTFTLTQKKDNVLLFNVSARSFLHHQVRNMVGTLLEVGREKYPPEEIKNILLKRDRRAAGPTIPASGLYFVKVLYPT